MKSPEQMGGLPEQREVESMKSKEEGERKVTTPEEAAEMTRQRRKKYGLAESRELTLEEAKEIEESIEKLLDDLDQHDFESCSPEMQDEWYYVAQEANDGKDRELAKAVLERFLKILQEEAGRLGK